MRLIITFSLLFFLARTSFAQQDSVHVYALIIGVNHYDSPKLPKLKYAESDALRFYNQAKTMYGIDTANHRSKVLLGAAATPERILLYANQFFNSSKPGNHDILLFFFSGHGSADDNGAGYLCTDKSDLDHLQETALPMNEVRSRLENGRSRIKMCFIDACRSGLFYKEGKGSSHQQAALTNEKLTELTGIPGSLVFLSSTQQQSSLEPDSLKSGLFTYYLIKGFQGAADHYGVFGNHDGINTVGEMESYLDDHIRLASGTHQRPQLSSSLAEDTPLSYAGDSKELDLALGNAHITQRLPQTDILASRRLIGSMGLRFDYADFRKSVMAGDTLAVGLFVKGGMKINWRDLVEFTTEHYKAPIARLINYSNSYEADCRTIAVNQLFYNFYEILRAMPERQLVMRGVCQPSDNKLLDSLIARESHKIDYYKAVKVDPEQSCLKNFKADLNKPIRQIANEYYSMGTQTQDLFNTLTFSPKQEIASLLNSALLVSNPEMEYDDLAFFKKAVKQRCPEFYVVLERSTYTLDLLKFAKEVRSF